MEAEDAALVIGNFNWKIDNENREDVTITGSDCTTYFIGCIIPIYRDIILAKGGMIV